MCQILSSEIVKGDGRALLYLQEDNTLKETATIAEELINRALTLDKKNPLALHLHIHISEASSPQRCVLAFDLMRLWWTSK